MELLVREFPDVFAFPRATTTRPLNEDALYRTDVPPGSGEAEQQQAFEIMTTKDGEQVEVSRPTYESVPVAGAQGGGGAGRGTRVCMCTRYRRFRLGFGVGET